MKENGMDTISRRLLKGTTKETAKNAGGRKDKFASIWRRSKCQTRVTVSAHFICILINSTRNGIVTRPSLWHLPYHPPRIFLVPSLLPPPTLLLSHSSRRSFLPLCATIRPAICGLHLFLRPRLLRHADLWLVLLTAARGIVFMPTLLVAMG